MPIPFLIFFIQTILYALIGFNVIKLPEHGGNRNWNKAVFFCSLAVIAGAFIGAMARLRGHAENYAPILFFIVALFFAFKLYNANSSGFKPIVLLHLSYIWFCLWFAGVLAMELIPYGSRRDKESNTFYCVTLLVLFLFARVFMKKKNTGNDQSAEQPAN